MDASIQKFLRNRKRVTKDNWQGQTIWLKKFIKNKSLGFVRIRDVMARLNKNPLYFSTEASDQRQINGEVKRLKLLAVHGVNVPKVLASGDGWFVMTDKGDSLRKLLHCSCLSNLERLDLLTEGAKALALLHSVGRWHGRPALRDLTWDGHAIAFVDFEEDVGRKLTPRQCQVRDLLIFLHDVVRFSQLNGFNSQQILHSCIQTYRVNSPTHVWAESLLVVKSMWLAYFILWSTQSFNGKDGRAALGLLRIMTEKQVRGRRRLYFYITLVGKLLLLQRLLDL